MSLFKRVRKWLLRKNSSHNLISQPVTPAVARDIGVRVTHIRLPSGYEITIVERAHENESE